MSTALVQISEKYPVLVPGSEAAAVIAANMAGEPVGIGDLSRIRVPAGGGTSWTVTDLDGEKQVRELEGVIVHVGRRRAYWSSSDPSGSPPDCASTDCITGVGTPGGDCQTCQLNQFGSAKKPDGKPGRGKACKESALLFLLRPGATMPDVVVVPPGSLKPVRQYRLRMTRPYYECVSRLMLSVTQNKDGIKFAQITPELVGYLDKTASDQVKQYADSLKGVFAAATVDHDDLDGDDD